MFTSFGNDAVRQVSSVYRPARGQLWLGAFLGALALGSSVGLLAASAWLISRAWQQPPILYLQVAVVSVRAFGIGRGVFRYAERLVSHQAALRSLVDLRVAMYERLIPLAPAGLPAFSRADLLRRVVDDVESMADLSLRVLLPAFSAVLVGLGSVLLTAWLLPASGFVMLAMLLVGGLLIPALIVRTAGRAQQVQAPLQAELATDLLTSMQAGAELAVAGRRDEYQQRVVDVDRRLTTAMARTASGAGLAAALGIVAQGTAIVLAILLAVPAVQDGSLRGVNLAVVVLLPLAVYEAVAVLSPAALTWIKVRAAAERLVEVMNAEPPVSEPDDPQRTVGSSIRMSQMSAQYPGGAGGVRDVTLTVANGQRLALMGSSGSGKSTTLSVLAKFLAYDGEVRIGELDLDRLPGAAVRQQVLWTPQNPHIFDSDIAANLRMADPDASDARLRDALDAVGLRQWSLTDSVGQHGATMSGGQRQRLGLARALLADCPVLLLDEPTEHLDPDTAADVLATIKAVTAGRSLVVVTHQPIDWVDETVVIA